MHPTADRADLVSRNRAEYGLAYAELSFVTPAAAQAANEGRDDLLATLRGGADSTAHDTKWHTGPLAPGCRACVAGTWSCLFINGLCNCRCFYCPVSQDEAGVPGTNHLDFPRTADYAEYTERFGFDGIGLSGGEPLLTPARALDVLQALRKRRGSAVHTWLYTNGTRLQAPLLRDLRDAGLDELRIDIAAVDYDLGKAEMAAAIIPTVTVEIPAVPEAAPRLRALLAAMPAAGVAHLNLHQLRLTPHNRPRLTGRGYTFLHGERVTVLESELTALELLVHARERGLPLPVHYCSFVYKHRCQRAAARRRAAAAVCAAGQQITQNGYLRTLDADGGAGLEVRYHEARVRPVPTFQYPFVEVELESGTRLCVETLPTGDELRLAWPEAKAFLVTVRAGVAPDPPPVGWRVALEREFVTPGLQAYF